MKTFANIQKEIISHLKSSARSAQGVLYSIGLVVTLLLVGTGNVWGENWTWTPTSTSSISGTSSNVTLNSKSWTVTRSKANYIGFVKNVGIQFGSQNAGAETVTFTSSAFTGTISSIVVQCSSYRQSHTLSVKVNNTNYSLSGNIGSGQTPASVTATGSSSGTIEIKLTAGSRACYIKSISITTAAATFSVTVKSPTGRGTYTDVSVTDKTKMFASGAFGQIVAKHKACTWSDSYMEAWNNAYVDYEISKANKVSTKPTNSGTKHIYTTEAGLPSSGTLYPLFIYGGYYYTEATCPALFVSYDANGATSGTAPSDGNNYEPNDDVTVLGQGTLTRTNYTFTGWNTESDGSGTPYDENDHFDMPDEDVYLYAEWCRDLTTLTSSEFDLEASSITGTSARIDWVVKDATKYDWALKKGASFDGGTSVSSGSNLTADYKELTGLLAGTQYWFKLTAKNDCGATSKEKIINFTTKAEYVITYYKNDGSGTSETESKTEGVNYTISSDKFSRDGYTLSKWNTQAGGGGTDYAKGATYSANAALELYAVWTPNNYTITLNGNGGSGNPASVSATYGSAAPSVGTLPTKADKNFAGYWTGSGGTGTMVVDASGVWVAGISGYTDASKNWIGTEGKTIYAKWVDKTYTNYRTTCSETYDIVLHDNNGGSHNGSAKVADGGKLLTNIVAPTRDGYSVEGYYAEAGTSTKIADASGVLQSDKTGYTDATGAWTKGEGATLYAKWTATNYTITYDGLEGASNSNPTSYNIATPTITLVAPGSREGYTFAGWTCGGSPITQIAVGSTGDKTITATWTANTYTVHFNANGGSGSMSPQNFTYGVAQNLTSNSFTHATKSFGGWTTNADGTGTEYSNGQSVSNLTSENGATVQLYAKWVDCELYTVTLKVNTDTYQVLTQPSCGAAVSLTGIEPPTCGSDYTFVGWSTTNPGTTTSPTITTSYNPGTSNKTLYAVYSKSDYIDWRRIESTGDLSTWDTYIITSYDYDRAMNATQETNNRHHTEITKSADKKTIASVPNTVGQFMIIEDGSNWNIYDMNAAGEGETDVYLIASGGSSSNKLTLTNDDTNGNAEWSISITDGAATVKAQGDAARNWMLDNSGTFTCYESKKSSYKLLSFYKYVHESATTYTTKPEITLYTVNKGAEDAVVGTYTVTPGLVCSGSSVSLSATPTGSNTFIGWVSDNGGTFANASSATTTFTPSAATTTVTANFGLAIVLDKNNEDGGSADGSAYVTANATSLSSVSAPTRTGYTVEGYYAEAGCTNQVADNTGALQANVIGYTGAGGAWTKGSGATLYANWTANTHTLTWNFDGGESSLTAGVGYTAGGIVSYGTAITYPTNVSMTKTGYTFNGWSTSVSSMPDDNLTITALWTQNNYTLTMAANPADKGANITSPRTGAGTVDNKHYGDVITVTVTKPEHYKFTGWTSSNGGTFANATALSTTFTMPDNATTVTANFTEDPKFTVTWSDNGDASNTTQVYSGGTTTFPALANGCDLYVAAGWTTSSFAAESLDKPASFWAVGAATPAVTADVTYKAVYRHKYYTTDEFVNGTTDGEGYYLYALYSDTKYYKNNSAPDLTTSTSKASAVPVYLEKVGGSYYMRDVATDKYFYGNSGNLAASDSKSATDAYKWTFSTPTTDPVKGDYKIVNEADKDTKTLLFNSSGSTHYIKEYAKSNETNNSYYNFYLEPAYYYKYTPTTACYTIQVTSNAWANGTFQTLSGSSPKYLVGNELTVTPQCGYHISSVSITGGTYTSSSSGRSTTYIITPSAACTFTVNFTTAQSNADKNTISFLDGSTVIGQTKTEAQYECGSYSLPDGYNTASREGVCDGWTFDGWTATNYTYGQMAAPSDIQAAGSNQTASGDKTWYAVYHKTYAAGAYFKLKYGDNYINGINGSNQFTVGATEADGLMFGLENDYLYYIDKTTRAKKWVYYQSNLVVDDNKPTSNIYKTTITANGGTYEVKCNGHWLELNGSGKVVFYASTDAARRPTRPDAAGFTAYYPKTDCAIEYVTVTYDAGAGNSCTPASVTVESGSTFTLPVEADITYDNSDWTFVGWSEGEITSIKPAAPGDLIAGGGSYSTFVDVTLHAVYSQTPPDPTFDNTKGGRYLIWGDDSGINYYAKSNGQVQGKLSNTLTCSEAAIFEFVETENAGEYKIHIVGEPKYLGGEGCGDANTDFIFVAAASAPVWTVAETATAGVWRITSTCGSRSFIFQNTGSRQFGHYASGNTTSDPGTYKNVHIGQCDDYYTTNPNKTLSVTGDVLVTSTNGRMVMAKDQLTINASNIGIAAPVTISSNSSDVYFSTTREVNISKAAKPTTSVSINANEYGVVDNQTIYVHYMPSVATDGIEEVTVTISSPEKTVDHTIKVRHLPATFAIAAKVGKNWYALTGNMSGAKTPAAIQIEVDESSWTAYAPDTCAYQLWPVMTTTGVGDRYQTQGEKVRLSAVNNKTTANAGLWANNSASQNTINNYAAITAITSDPAAQYEWKIAATEVSGTWKYTLQMDQGVGNNNNKLNLHRDANLVWGTYTDGQAVTGDIYLLPISEITPFDFQVVEWYPTKVLIQTEAALTSPSVKIAGEAVASPVLTNKGGKLWEISGLTTLAANPTEMLKINYTKDAVTYSGIKSIPVIISRSTQNVTAEPFTTLTKEVYNYADLVVRDGAVLTMNGTEAENKFYDVTIYPTSKISVPEGKKLGVHSLTFFGGIDEIYNGSTYTENKYGVPELSLKGLFGTKTVGTIDYVMRVDDSQMYSLTVPYDVNLADITYWDGTSMGTLGDKLWVSAYDGAARANKDMSHTWIWEANFASKGLEEKLKAGVGYTISADLQAGVGSTYSILRMPMKSNVAANATESAKTVAVTAHGIDSDVSDNHKGWNLVGNPYMVSISGGEPGSQLVVGKLVESGTGPWDWDGTTYPYRYVTIPFEDGSDYYQMKFKDATLKPFKNFFVQIDNTTEGNALGFALASRQNAPARYLQVQDREVEFEILLSNDSRHDNMGLLIADQYSPAYEINADLEKMIGSMSVYTIYGGYNLAYNALSPTDAEQLIPVGYVVPAAGEYTFQLDDQSNYEQVEHIYLTDYEKSRTVDLLDDAYTFETVKGKNESRFAINVILKEEKVDVTTGIHALETDNEKPQKFIYQDKIYILIKGVIYDATGKKVSEINK